MFHMMNEARIGVGLGATMLGFAGYEASLDYAKNRPQGRPVGPGGQGRGAAAGAHHRARRRQAHAAGAEDATAKARWRSSSIARGSSTSCTPATTPAAADARTAARGADADRQELAERVVPGGEQPRDPGPRRLRLHARLPGRAVLARQPPEHDPRGHARHPGARPARPQGGDGQAAPGCELLAERIDADDRARRPRRSRPRRARRRAARRPGRHVGAATRAAWSTGEPDEALANATPYLQAFGHVVLAWIWLDVACASPAAAPTTPPSAGRLAALPLLLPLRAAAASAPGSASSRRATTPAAAMAEDGFLKHGPYAARHRDAGSGS